MNDKVNYQYNRIVIVGNGLDLAMGLKTSYSDFLLDYFEKQIEAAKHQKNISDTLFSIGNTAQIFYREDDYSNIIKFNELIDRNPHWKVKFYGILFEIMKNPSNKNWVDIEALYFDSMMPMVDEAKKTKDFSKIKTFNDSFRELSHHLDTYISRIKSSNNIGTMGTNYKGFFEKMHKKQSESAHLGNHKVEDKDINDPDKVLFLNFNFTNSVYDYCSNVNGFDRRPKVKNIHGSAGVKEAPIIFGYGDDTHPYYSIIEQERSDIPLEFIKSFYYGRTDDYHKMLGFMESGPFEVFIVGHSCGLSDRTLLKSIFEHQDCVSIKIFHRGTFEEYFRKNMAISRHFENKQLLRKRVLSFDDLATIPQTPKKVAESSK